MSSTLVYSLMVGIYVLLMWKAGKIFPVLYLFLFTYFLQYIFSTYLIYNEYKVLGKQMIISQDAYFNYTMPALLFLFLGLFLFNKDFDISASLKRINQDQTARLGYFLLVVSFSFDLLLWIGVTPVRSLVSFTEYLKYVAAFCFLFTRSKFNYFLIGVVYARLAVLVLQSGVFIDFFIWSTYLFFFISLKLRFPFILRLSFILIAAPLLIVIQSVKQDYRQATWTNEREGGFNLLTELAEKRTANNNQSFVQSKGVVSTVGRLTQGWHLGLTLDWVPKRTPFKGGEEMFSDVVSSILPRLIFSDKKQVGAQDKFYKYTGHKLQSGTSMTIGVLGDFYINYGRWGSFIMLFVFGAFIALILRFFFVRYVSINPLNIVWIPFLLNYLIRANNDFYMVFNNLVKGFLIFLFISFIIRKWWPKDFVNEHP